MPGTAPIAWYGTTSLYIQKVQYGSAAQATSHNIVFPKTPTNGNLLVIHALTDKGAMTTPAGWTADLTQTAGTLNLVTFRKTAGASEPSTISITCVASIMAAIGYELPISGLTGAVDDTASGTQNQSLYTNCVSFLHVTHTPDFLFCAAGFLNTGHVNTGDGPYFFDSGLVSDGYALAVSSGTSSISIEIAVGIYVTPGTAFYSPSVSSSILEIGTFGPILAIAYK